MIKIPFGLIMLTVSAVWAHPQSLRVMINELPVYHPAGSDIYIAGSFNGWNPADDNYKFRKDDKGNYYLDLSLKEDVYEYKLTRGSWDKSECRKGGVGLNNRQLRIPSEINPVSLAIEEWTDRYPAKPKTSTASRNVHIIDTSFLIPQLKRTRKIWIYLPAEYGASPAERFPVLYMHDGQNLFDDSTSYAGEWAVDEYLDLTALTKSIVVGIDNGGVKRMNEYNPYDHSRFGKGEGGKYTEFIAKTLKPYIDKKYRTLKDKEHTFIAGSSMGGLISMYAVLKYPTIFGGAGVFSPSFAIGGPKIFGEMKKKGSKVNSRIYFYAGKQENEKMVPDMLKAFETMTKVSKSKMTSVIRDEGAHNEARWRVEFPLFYEWLMKNRK